MFGRINFTAAESFDAILGEPSGPIFGGGARVGLPLGGLFVDVGAWRFHGEGERVFVFDGEVFALGIPVEITVTPLEISAGWRFRIRRAAEAESRTSAGGLTVAASYQETSDFATPAENVDERFNGYHLLGGAEYKITRWLGVGGEASWTTVPDAIGESGVSAAVQRNRSRRHDASASRSRSADDAVRAEGPDDRVAHSGRARDDLRRRREAGRAARRGARGRQHHAARPIARGCPTIASSPPAARWAAIRACRSNARCWRAEGLTVTPRRVVGFAKIRWPASARSELRRVRRSGRKWRSRKGK